MFKIGTYIDPSEYYEAAAKHCARWEINPPQLAYLTACVDLPAFCLSDIALDEEAFARRVAEYAYGMSMANSPDYA